MNLYFNSMEKNYLIYFKLFLTFVIFFNCGELFSQTYTNTTPGTYTIQVPAGVTSLQAEAWGAGGAGAGNNGNALKNGGGGGGGYARTPNIPVSATTSYTVTVGAGGTSKFNSSNNSVTQVHGGASSFGTTVIATGGKTPQSWEDFSNSTSNTGPTGATGSTGSVTYNGGNGGYGAYPGNNYSASGGGGAGSSNNGSAGSNTSNTSTIGGAGGSTGGGKGGNGRNSNIVGLSGTSSGGGGGGVAATGYSGGAGASGKILLTYSCPTYSLSNTAAQTTSPNNSSLITVTGPTSTLPVGTYTVTYDLSSPNSATNNTATMTVSTAGTGTFSTTTLTTVSTTTITIKTLSSGSGNACSSALTANNTTNILIANIPTIVVTGNNITIANRDVTPSTTDNTNFSTVQISSLVVTKTFIIKNTGSTTLTLTSSPTISGTNSSNFTVTTAPSLSVASGGSTTFQISFSPITTGTKTATVSISSNDTYNSPYEFALEGEAVQYFYDSDGDGVLDDVDVDDDNDGILDVTEEANCKAVSGYAVNYKFLNETFGTGTRVQINTTYDATTTYCYQDATTPTVCEGSPNSTDLNDGKYTVGPTAQIASWAAGIWWLGGDHTGDANGRMALFNASYNPGIFYTAKITGALPNIPVTYSFWVLNLDRISASGRLKPNIKVEFKDLNDTVLATIYTGDITNDEIWHQFKADLNLPANAFKVIFTNNNVGGLGNDLAIDDIQITQTLCDRDGDGIPDLFDLDSDNDGIPDVVEAGLGYISNGKGKIDISWVDTTLNNGPNGLHDGAESAAALPALDSDGDGIPNYLDLDSDNDSVFDVDESGAGNTNAVAGYVNGDGDINDDGVGDRPESEAFRLKDVDGNGVPELFGDGILDLYDYGTAANGNQYGNLDQGISNSNAATTYLKDSDGDGIPDYLDLKSNGTTFDIENNKLIYLPKIFDDGYGKIIGTADIDKDGILDAFDTNTAQFGSPRDMNTKLYLDFDGRNDYGQSTAILGGLTNASLMAWIDLNAGYTGAGVIVGQNNFQLRITAAKNLEAVVNGTTLTFNTLVAPFSSTTLTTSQWYHVAAVYDGTNSLLKLFLNGNMVASTDAPGAIASDTSLLTIGRDPSTMGPTGSKYFKGKIDEVRVFNVALSDSFLQRMVYQEIQNFSSEIRGTIVPKNIATSPSSLPFTNLLRYYRMDAYKDDIIDDLTTTAIDVTGTKIYNHKNMYVQQAPMPFLTERTGTFAVAVNNTAKDIRGVDIMENDWSIVKVQHDIIETANNIDLGMFVDPSKTINMTNNTKIQNDWYLKLDGKIDLVGMSQLLQTTESDLDVTSAGSIERDQQGQPNKFNYNYWSSPVSTINKTVNNNDYTVAEIMKDGTNSTPVDIKWIGGYDGNASSPISLARYWLYKFDSYYNAYANWVAIGEKGTVRVGQGFTLKGSGATTALQNYTFVGKPNNGLIATNSVGRNQLLLAGNPYPSALDADAFIRDNLNTLGSNTSDATNGSLYFWEHYSSNNTHILRDYQGGYAVRNLVGGIAPSSANVNFISKA
ncbi:choice-of-anchor D domain-containing protein [Flavobacterium sp. Arc3]|uniref:LamG-like jellyroll fold domain-containing protein n=1 Tax=Flavobacterium sp. Arc3 TaxID=3046686 RepID=UPI00352F59DE